MPTHSAASLNAVEAREKGTSMISLSGEYRILIFVIYSLITVSFVLTSYCYLNSRKQVWYEYLWRGFSLMTLGCVLILLGLTLNIPKPLSLLRQVVVLPLGIYGFSLIMLGEKKKGIRTSRKDELTERIRRRLSKRLEQKDSNLYY